MFDWKRFLQANHIEFVERGPNVARGNVAIACPFCGAGDQSHHLGISLKGKGWGCWRNADHRGKAPHRLIQELLHCSYSEADNIVGDEGVELVGDGDLAGAVSGMLGVGATASVRAVDLRWPREIKPLTVDGEYAQLFIRYLKGRGYTGKEVRELIELYGLRYAYRGPFVNRVIIPVFTLDGLMTWTGRAIERRSTIRYKTLSQDAEKAAKENMPVARANIKDLLLNQGELSETEGRSLVVCEGPLDALRVDYYGRRFGIRATCVFSKTISDAQLAELTMLRENYDQAILVLDQDAGLDVLATLDRLQPLGFIQRKLPKGVGDPAELPSHFVRSLFS